jgi:hypothetical protein
MERFDMQSWYFKSQIPRNERLESSKANARAERTRARLSHQCKSASVLCGLPIVAEKPKRIIAARHLSGPG